MRIGAHPRQIEAGYRGSTRIEMLRRERKESLAVAMEDGFRDLKVEYGLCATAGEVLGGLEGRTT